MEAETKDGLCHSLLLQNAETVRLIAPADATIDGTSSVSAQQTTGNVLGDAAGQLTYQAVSVTDLQLGQAVYLHLQDAARHTGISINESIIEK